MPQNTVSSGCSFEPDLPEFRVVFGDKRLFTHMSSAIKSIRIDNNLTRITKRADFQFFVI